MSSDKGCRKEKNQNIQVSVRLRPLNQRERDIKSLGVIEVINNREVVVRQSPQTSLSKKFTFDRAFAPNASQVQVYQEVVAPLIEEVLAGYNCTVFAYGQTGTGKTHTMVGENSGDESNWQNDPLAGIIPRALSQLFDELRLTNTEYTVRVSYLELYNEELFDLLSTTEDNSKLRIYEDVTRKGSNIVNGLEEITVYNKNEVYKIMAQGQERKKVASTLMNAQSSRSHTVFTIVVHMKENSPEGEELVKIGKLNLVDLAGSENISKAGSDNPAKKERARECVNINQSLLTLGRVITALVERHPHIPYRESKLTRILQESLGGRTKTSIIATISPGHKDMEETLSTLEYAHRAKNIQNKPEVNQKMTKKAILKEYSEEIDRLKRDLQATRDKNGVYLATETYTEITLKQEEYRKEIQELILKKRAMEEERDRMEGIFNELSNTLRKKENELYYTKNRLADTSEKLVNTTNVLKTTTLRYEEQKHLVEKHHETEEKLSHQAKTLLANAELATQHVNNLHCTVDKRKTIENANLHTTQTYREHSAAHRDHVLHKLNYFVEAVTGMLDPLKIAIEQQNSVATTTQKDNRQKIENFIREIVDTTAEIKQLTKATQSELAGVSLNHRDKLNASVRQHGEALQAHMNNFMERLTASILSAADVDVKGNVDEFVQEWYVYVSDKLLQSLLAGLSSLAQEAQVNTNASLEAARRRRDGRKIGLVKRDDNYNACLAELKQEKSQMDQRLSKQLQDIEADKQETARLQKWMQEERSLLEEQRRVLEEQRRLLEERIASHLEAERCAMETWEQKLSQRVQEVENEKRVMEERFDRYVQWHKKQMQLSEEEMAQLDADLQESEREIETNSQCISKFETQLGDGINSITDSIQKFTRQVVDVVECINAKSMQALRDTKDSVEEQVLQVVQTEQQESTQFLSDIDHMIQGLLGSSEETLRRVDEKVQSTSTSAENDLTVISNSLASLISLSESQAASHLQTLDSMHNHVEQFQGELRQDVKSQAAIEGRYLKQEYKVYSPTGSTPVRQEYSFPRQLVSTSPHERILARFKARRYNADEDDVIIVDNDSCPTSDGESSVSEESPVEHQHPPLVKSTSDTELFLQQNANNRSVEASKENLTRFSGFRKPSKLPAPASHKKVLAERNGN